MESKKEEKNLNFAQEAFLVFDKMMANNKRNMFDNISGVNKGELFVLGFLVIEKRQVLPSELSAALQVSNARVSSLLSSLEKKGQITREIDKNNRRKILVSITKAGIVRIETISNERKNSMIEVFKEMGESDTKEFIRLIKEFFALSKKCINDFNELER